MEVKITLKLKIPSQLLKPSIEEEAGSPTQDNWKFNYFIYTWHHSAFIPIGLDRKLCSFYENDATNLSSPGEADDKFHQLFFLFHFPFIIFPFSPLLIVLSYKLCQKKKKKKNWNLFLPLRTVLHRFYCDHFYNNAYLIVHGATPIVA